MRILEGGLYSVGVRLSGRIGARLYEPQLQVADPRSEHLRHYQAGNGRTAMRRPAVRWRMKVLNLRDCLQGPKEAEGSFHLLAAANLV